MTHSSARLKWCTIEGYKSIRDQVVIQFPQNKPLVLVGENNAGKSNIVSALDLVLGEYWPGNQTPEDHDFWARDSRNGAIHIEVGISGVKDRYNRPIMSLKWECGSDGEVKFRAKQDNGEEKWVNNEIRDQLMLITIGADRRLNYQLSYASKYTFLSKLMRKFHTALTNDTNRVDRLHKAFQELEEIL